jgi:gamma-butyrobetaine dioxygenase
MKGGLRSDIVSSSSLFRPVCLPNRLLSYGRIRHVSNPPRLLVAPGPQVQHSPSPPSAPQLPTHRWFTPFTSSCYATSPRRGFTHPKFFGYRIVVVPSCSSSFSPKRHFRAFASSSAEAPPPEPSTNLDNKKDKTDALGFENKTQARTQPQEESLPDILHNVQMAPRHLTVVWKNGCQASYHYVWLRHNCPCAKCVQPHSGQKLIQFHHIPSALRARYAKIKEESDILEVEWPDGHVSSFGGQFLRLYNYGKEARSRRRERWGGPSRKTWTPETLVQAPHLQLSYSEVLNTDQGLLNLLEQLHRYGIAIIKNVPTQLGEISKVAERVGPIRDSIYGRVWDVKSLDEPNNIAYSSVALPLHMDLMYYELPPGFQFLHCLVNKASGGSNIFIDGFKVAELMREEMEERFQLLTRARVTYHYCHPPNHWLRQRRPVIELDSETGDLKYINFAPAFEGPLDLDFDEVDTFYESFRKFTKMIEDANFHFWRMPEEGDLVVFDNRRVLHARTAFTGDRHLQGTYVDRDALDDTFRCLHHKLALPPEHIRL